jgi:hypothetical protein
MGGGAYGWGAWGTEEGVIVPLGTDGVCEGRRGGQKKYL